MTADQREEELERRRREHASPAQKVVEEFIMERLDSATEHLPSKGHVTRLSLREIMVAIDDAVRKGLTIPYPEYVGYWRRWIASRWYWCALRGRVRARHCNGYYCDLLVEHLAYYEKRNKLSFPGPYSDKEWAKKVQEVGKKAYHEQAKPVRAHNGVGQVIERGKLVYQVPKDEEGFSLAHCWF